MSGALTPSMPRSSPGRAFADQHAIRADGDALALDVDPAQVFKMKTGATSRCVSSAIWIVPGPAVCSMRAARFTASPIAVYSAMCCEPTSPTTTGPVLIPMRTTNPGRIGL